jgi:hypothetical protein
MEGSGYNPAKSPEGKAAGCRSDPGIRDLPGAFAWNPDSHPAVCALQSHTSTQDEAQGASNHLIAFQSQNGH